MKPKRYRIAQPGSAAYAETDSPSRAAKVLREATQLYGNLVRAWDTKYGCAKSHDELLEAARLRANRIFD